MSCTIKYAGKGLKGIVSVHINYENCSDLARHASNDEECIKPEISGSSSPTFPALLCIKLQLKLVKSSCSALV